MKNRLEASTVFDFSELLLQAVRRRLMDEEVDASMMNPEAWETVNGFTANIKEAIEWLGKLGVYFPENQQQIAEAAARIEAECDAALKSLLTEALTGMRSKIAGPEAIVPAKPARLTIEEVTGKRIRRLYLEELPSESCESYLAIEFDDDTEVVVEIQADVVSRHSFGMGHHFLDKDVDVRPLKEHIRGSISSLVEQQDSRRPIACEVSQ